MQPVVTFLIWVTVILAPFFVIGLVNIYRLFRCPDCGRVHPDAYLMMALLPFGLVVPALFVPLIGPPIAIIIVALKPRWLLAVDAKCVVCEAALPVGLSASAGIA